MFADVPNMFRISSA